MCTRSKHTWGVELDKHILAGLVHNRLEVLANKHLSASMIHSNRTANTRTLTFPSSEVGMGSDLMYGSSFLSL